MKHQGTTARRHKAASGDGHRPEVVLPSPGVRPLASASENGALGHREQQHQQIVVEPLPLPNINRRLLSAATRSALTDAYHHHHADIDTFWGVYRFLNTTIGISVSPPRLEMILDELGIHLQAAPTPKPSSPRGPSATDIAARSRQQSTPFTILTVAQLEHLVAEVMFSEDHDVLYGDDDRALLSLAIKGEQASLFPDMAADGGALPRVGGATAPSSLVQGVLSSIQANLKPYLLQKQQQQPSGGAIGAPAAPQDDASGAAAELDIDSVWRHLCTTTRSRRSTVRDTVAQQREPEGRGGGSVGSADVLQQLFRRFGGSASAEDHSSDSASQCTRASLHGGSSSLFDGSPLRGASLSKTSMHRGVRKSFMHALDYSRESQPPPEPLQAAATQGATTGDAQEAGAAASSLRNNNNNNNNNNNSASSAAFVAAYSMVASDDRGSPLESPTDPFECVAFPQPQDPTKHNHRSIANGNAVSAPIALRPRTVSVTDAADSTEELLRGARALMDSDDGSTAFGSLLQPGELKQVEASLGDAEQRRASLLSRHESVVDLFEQRKRTTRLSSLNNAANGEHRVSVVSFSLDGVVSVPDDGGTDLHNNADDAARCGEAAAAQPGDAVTAQWHRLRASIGEMRHNTPTTSRGGASSALSSARTCSTDRDRPSSSASFFIKNAKQRAALTKAEKFLLQSKRMTAKTLDKQILAFDEDAMQYLGYDTNKAMAKRRSELIADAFNDTCSLASSSTTTNEHAEGRRVGVGTRMGHAVHDGSGRSPAGGSGAHSKGRCSVRLHHHHHHGEASSPSSVSSFPSVHSNRHTHRGQLLSANRNTWDNQASYNASPGSPTSSCRSLQCLRDADPVHRGALADVAPPSLATSSPLWERWTTGGRGL